MYASLIHPTVRSWAMPGVALVAALSLAIAPAAAASGISQGYILRGSAPVGSLVGVVPGVSNTVEASNSERADDLLGVVVGAASSLISASSSTSQVQVASSGSVSTLVSTINGEIKSGDRVTASPLAGVGMRVSENGKVVGVAEQDFSRTSPGAAMTKLRDTSGVERSVWVGQIPVMVSAVYYAGAGSSRSIIPLSIQNLANQIAGRQVGTLAILLSFLIVFIALLSITALVYGAIRGSIVSIGRNPLSRGTVYRSLLQISFLVIGILVASVGSVYLILRHA